MIDRLPLARHRWEWQKQGRAIRCLAAGTATVSPCWTFLMFPHFLPHQGTEILAQGQLRHSQNKGQDKSVQAGLCTDLFRKA